MLQLTENDSISLENHNKTRKLLKPKQNAFNETFASVENNECNMPYK